HPVYRPARAGSRGVISRYPAVSPRRTGLFVRIPASAAEKLDRAAFELGTPKQDLVSGLVARYVDPTPKGLATLRRTITVESADDSMVMGRHSFVPNEEREVMTLAEVAELVQSREAA